MKEQNEDLNSHWIPKPIIPFYLTPLCLPVTPQLKTALFSEGSLPVELQPKSLLQTHKHDHSLYPILQTRGLRPQVTIPAVQLGFKPSSETAPPTPHSCLQVAGPSLRTHTFPGNDGMQNQKSMPGSSPSAPEAEDTGRVCERELGPSWADLPWQQIKPGPYIHTCPDSWRYPCMPPSPAQAGGVLALGLFLYF